MLQVGVPIVESIVSDLRSKGHPEDVQIPDEHAAKVAPVLTANIHRIVRCDSCPVPAAAAPAPMRKGTAVTWITSSDVHGSGITITDEADGHVQVAVDAPAGQEHRLIYCAVTWLRIAQNG